MKAPLFLLLASALWAQQAPSTSLALEGGLQTGDFAQKQSLGLHLAWHNLFSNPGHYLKASWLRGCHGKGERASQLVAVTFGKSSGDANPWQPSWGGGIGYWSHPNETSEHIPPDLVPGVIASDAWVFVLEANLHYQPGGRWFFGAGLQGWAEISDNADTSDVLQSLRAHAFLGLKW